jgi:hypothetical protein
MESGGYCSFRSLRARSPWFGSTTCSVLASMGNSLNSSTISVSPVFLHKPSERKLNDRVLLVTDHGSMCYRRLPDFQSRQGV